MMLALAMAPPDGAIAIEHAPLECVPFDRYTRIAATGVPAEGVAGAQLQFRSHGDSGWYAIGMATHGAEWAAYLPRPTRSLDRLEYRIVMRSKGAGEAATPAIVARLGEECVDPRRSSPDVPAPIVVRVPEGAPAVPPVPTGFSPAGVVAAEDRVRRASVKELLIGAALGGGVTTAVVVGARTAPRDVTELPTLAFAGTAPPPGTVLSLRRDRLSVLMDLTGDATPIHTLFWVVELLGAGGGPVCVSMNARLTVVPRAPATVTLTAPFFPRVACGERFDVDRAHLLVSINGRTVYDEIHAPLPFHFEP